MNLIIIVGGEHHNGLGLARIFGLNNFIVYSMVVSEGKTNFLSKSKFVHFSKLFDTEKDAFDYILENYSHMEEPAIVIPYSDGAALELDSRLNEFKDKFYVPSINGEQGKIAYLMNKANQYNYALDNNIRMAQTVSVNFDTDYTVPLNEIKLPCILKPIISAEGDKKDIRICNSFDELLKELQILKGKQYRRILVQEYLTVDYEIDVFGCICKNNDFVSLIPTRTIRAYPPKGGTNSFSQIIIDEKIVEQCKTIIAKLKTLRFCGLYDIELFVVGNEIILNEINFRNSGDVYMGVNQKYYYPVYWVNDLLNKLNTEIMEHPAKDEYCMTEFADLRNVFKHECSFLQWYKDYKNTSDYALKFKGDMKPYYSRVLYYIKKILGFYK